MDDDLSEQLWHLTGRTDGAEDFKFTRHTRWIIIVSKANEIKKQNVVHTLLEILLWWLCFWWTRQTNKWKKKKHLRVACFVFGLSFVSCAGQQLSHFEFTQRAQSVVNCVSEGKILIYCFLCCAHSIHDTHTRRNVGHNTHTHIHT